MINRFNINEINHKIIKDEISRLQNGGKKEDVLPKVKIVVEDLTGYKYSDIWNSNN
jgi:oligogalacturonide transporter